MGREGGGRKREGKRLGEKGGGGKGKERDWERRGGKKREGEGWGEKGGGGKGKERDWERRGGRKREGEGLGEKGGGKIQFQSKINKQQNKIKATTHKHMG